MVVIVMIMLVVMVMITIFVIISTVTLTITFIKSTLPMVNAALFRFLFVHKFIIYYDHCCYGYITSACGFLTTPYGVTRGR